ncbi:MAG: hypothetical protein A2W36_00235 [Chloroflexi bacterium RBG_16_58_14]|nr:MAG: hypothetical protein A2W36_00235 [Chloroflexi bacterium RBG_16_58_14]
MTPGLSNTSSGQTKPTLRNGYLAYLVRLWQVNQNGDLTWRAYLEDAHSGESRGFTSLDGLFGFLRQRVVEYSNEAEEQHDHPATS